MPAGRQEVEPLTLTSVRRDALAVPLTTGTVKIRKIFLLNIL